jgi:hypothetical protein
MRHHETSNQLVDGIALLKLAVAKMARKTSGKLRYIQKCLGIDKKSGDFS